MRQFWMSLSGNSTNITDKFSDTWKYKIIPSLLKILVWIGTGAFVIFIFADKWNFMLLSVIQMWYTAAIYQKYYWWLD